MMYYFTKTQRQIIQKVFKLLPLFMEVTDLKTFRIPPENFCICLWSIYDSIKILRIKSFVDKLYMN